MKKLREEQREISTRKMLDAAIVEFANNGYVGAKVADVAERAGVTKGLVLSRFGSKEGLYTATLVDRYETYCSVISSNDTLKSILLKIISDIKASAKFKTTELLFISDFLNAQNYPAKCEEDLIKVVNNSVLARKIKEGMKNGQIDFSGECCDILKVFLRTTLAISVGYADGGLEFLDDKEYLKLIKYVDNEDEETTLVDNKLVERYQLVLSVSMSNDEYEIVYQDDKFATFDEIARETNNFYILVENAVKPYLYNEDVKNVEYLLSKDIILDKLQLSDSFLIFFRVNSLEGIRHFQAKISRGEDLGTFMLALREAEVEGKEFIKAAKNAAIIETLAKDCEYVFYINTRINEVTHYYMSEAIAEKLNKIRIEMPEEMNTWAHLDALMKMIVDPAVFPDFVENTSMCVVLETLEIRDEFTYTFLGRLKEEAGYYELKIRRDNRSDNGFIVQFIDVTASIKEHIEKMEREIKLYEKENAQRQSVLNSFLEDVTVAYMVNLNSGMLKRLKKKPLTIDLFPNDEDIKQHYDLTMKTIINNIFLDEERDRIFLDTNFDIIKRRLQKERSISVISVDRRDDKLRFVEIRYTRIGDGPDYELAMMGFANVTEKMIARKSRSALSGDPRTTFIIGTHNRKYRCLGEHSLHESVLPTQGDYDKVIGRVFENVDKEYLPVLQNITSCERLKLFLAEGDHKEITYHCSGEEKPWRRVIFNCILREGGEPLLIAMTFFELDVSAAEQLDIKQQLNRVNLELLENKALNEFFLDGFVAAHYINIEDGTFDIYRGDTDILNKYDNYFEGMKEYIPHYIAFSNRKDIEEMLDPDYIRNQLKVNRSYSRSIKAIEKGEPRYYSIQIIRGADDRHVAVAFTDIDEVMKAKRAQSRTEKSYQQAILAKAQNYFRGNLSKNQIIPPIINKVGDQIYDQTHDFDKKNLSYEKTVRMMAEKMVAEESKKDYIKNLSSRYLMSCYSKGNTMPEFIARVYSDSMGWHYCRYVTYLSKDDANGDIYNMTVAYDVTEEIKQELKQQEINEKMAEAKKMAEEANDAKSRFLFNMSHDIRTPMNAIIGFTEQARKNLEDKELVDSCLEKVEISNNYLLRLIDDVLDMARIESGKLSIEEAVWDVEASTKEVIEMFEGLTKEKNITFEKDLDNLQNKYVYMDALRVRQILSNVLSNAVKYTRPGGKIKLTLQEKTTRKKGFAAYEIKVEDNGIGMSKEFVDHIFEQFTREKSSTKSGVQGTGLGMAIVKQLVDIMEGKIQVESETGRGTSITILLKLRIADKRDSSDVEADLNTNLDITGVRVLLVEDNELNRELAKVLLTELGAKVDEAEDGAIAVEKVSRSKAGRYDIVLMDIQMPYMDGYEATREIRELTNKKLRNIPIVAMTANAFEEDRRKAFEIGMNDHITKPINSTELIKVICKYAKK